MPIFIAGGKVRDDPALERVSLEEHDDLPRLCDLGRVDANNDGVEGVTVLQTPFGMRGQVSYLGP